MSQSQETDNRAQLPSHTQASLIASVRDMERWQCAPLMRATLRHDTLIIGGTVRRVVVVTCFDKAQAAPPKP